MGKYVEVIKLEKGKKLEVVGKFKTLPLAKFHIEKTFSERYPMGKFQTRKVEILDKDLTSVDVAEKQGTYINVVATMSELDLNTLHFDITQDTLLGLLMDGEVTTIKDLDKIVDLAVVDSDEGVVASLKYIGESETGLPTSKFETILTKMIFDSSLDIDNVDDVVAVEPLEEVAEKAVKKPKEVEDDIVKETVESVVAEVGDEEVEEVEGVAVEEVEGARVGVREVGDVGEVGEVAEVEGVAVGVGVGEVAVGVGEGAVGEVGEVGEVAEVSFEVGEVDGVTVESDGGKSVEGTSDEEVESDEVVVYEEEDGTLVLEDGTPCDEFGTPLVKSGDSKYKDIEDELDALKDFDDL